MYAFDGGPLIEFRITNEEKILIDKIRKHARENPVLLEILQDMIAGTRPPVGDADEFSIWLGGDEFPVRAVYSIENQPKGKKFIHMSFSARAPVTYKACIPSPRIISTVLSAFGMMKAAATYLSCFKKDGHYNNVIILREDLGIPVINVFEELKDGDGV